MFEAYHHDLQDSALLAKSSSINITSEIWLQSYLGWYRRMEMRMHYNLPVESAAESNFRQLKGSSNGR